MSFLFLPCSTEDADADIPSAYKDQYGCNFTSAIPTNIFGPNDNLYAALHSLSIAALV